MKSIKNLCVACLAISVSNCAVKPVIEERPTIAELPPMEKLDFGKNTKVVQLNAKSGAETHYMVTDVEPDGSHRGTGVNGCSWTKKSDFLAPPTRWENCGQGDAWSSGENRITDTRGDIWPLQVGNKISYKYQQINSAGSESAAVLKCEVTAAVNISVPAGDIDTYKIVCTRKKGNWSKTVTRYLSPEYLEVKYVERQSDKGITHNYDLVRNEPL